jgi:hypothetical protein
VENGGKGGGNSLTDGAGVSVRENSRKFPAVSNGSWIDSSTGKASSRLCAPPAERWQSDDHSDGGRRRLL